VRAARIERAAADGAGSVDAIGEVTGAGQVCGSCRPEIAYILAARQVEVLDAV
jgi:assimilatory nitrate reductase catalytic subunit